MIRVVVAAALTTFLACGGANRSRVSWPDAPVQLRDDADRDAAIDQLWVMPPGAARDQVRAQIATALAGRISDAIEEDRPFVAARLFAELTSIWHADARTIGTGLAPHAALLEKLRGLFAKAGALEPAVQILVVLAELQADQRAAHLAELDELLAFADELAFGHKGEVEVVLAGSLGTLAEPPGPRPRQVHVEALP